MTVVAHDTRDTKLAWLTFLHNVGFNLWRLRRDYPTICPSVPAKSLKSVTESTCMVEEEIDELGLKLMDSWGINQRELYKWMDLGPEDLAKRMAWKGSIVSHLVNSHIGRTRKSQRR